MSYHVAERSPGMICQGTLWRTSCRVPNLTAAAAAAAAAKDQTCEYALLFGVHLYCYDSWSSYQKAEPPVACLVIVGASAWNPLTTRTKTTRTTSTTKSNVRNLGSSSSTTTLTSSTTMEVSSSETSFRLVTSNGTHVYCQVPTPKCRELWLSTLHAGLAQAMKQATNGDNNGNSEAAEPQLSLPPQKPPSPQVSWRRRTGGFMSFRSSSSNNTNNRSLPFSNSLSSSASSSNNYCHSCGAISSVWTGNKSAGNSHHSSSGTALLASTSSASAAAASATPLPQYGWEQKCPVCWDCCMAQGLWDHTEFIKHCLDAAQQEEAALVQARELCAKIMEAHNDTAPQPISTGSHSPKRVGMEEATAELRGTETVLILDDDEGERGGNSNSPSRGVRHTSKEDDEPPLPPDWHAVKLEETSSPTNSTHCSSESSQPQSPNSNGGTNSNAWIHLPPTAANTKALLKLLNDPVQFGMLKRISPWLEDLCSDLQSGCIGVPDFLEELDSAVVSHQSAEAKDMAALKTQALHLAGDMGTAIKLLAHHALPKSRREIGRTSTGKGGGRNHATARDTGSTKVLSCILDFFLEMCEQGESSSVAFFWPQFCHIHLRMLPPENAADVARVELYEDFLMTVAAHYSIHLALELIWSHTADLEDSLAINGTSSVPCKRRRFAVLRFVCELESLLFDFDDGWGGGTVSLGKMLQPTGHQVELLKRNMKQIQEYRKKRCSNRLVRSFRLDKLSRSKFDEPSEEAVLEKLRIAKNAEYFSSHLNFTKRICDVAEKLRFLELEQRAGFLQQELELLNSSGSMGGDPLNRVNRDLIRVVRVPPSEGHVFRSKERTPVLLLMEVVNEGAEPAPEEEDELFLQKKDLFKVNATADESEQSVPSHETEKYVASQESSTIPFPSCGNEDEKTVEDDPDRSSPVFTDGVPDNEYSSPTRQERTMSDMEGSLEDSRMGIPRSPRRKSLLDLFLFGLSLFGCQNRLILTVNLVLFFNQLPH